MNQPFQILVVDDNDAGVFLVRSLLELERFLVDSADSSENVLERLKDSVPDLILMDVQLPGQDGLSLTRQLKADPATAAVPIVALTANVMPGDREQAFAAGCIGYISKRSTPERLATRSGEYLPGERIASRIAG